MSTKLNSKAMFALLLGALVFCMADGQEQVYSSDLASEARDCKEKLNEAGDGEDVVCEFSGKALNGGKAEITLTRKASDSITEGSVIAYAGTVQYKCDNCDGGVYEDNIGGVIGSADDIARALKEDTESISEQATLENDITSCKKDENGKALSEVAALECKIDLMSDLESDVEKMEFYQNNIQEKLTTMASSGNAYQVGAAWKLAKKVKEDLGLGECKDLPVVPQHMNSSVFNPFLDQMEVMGESDFIKESVCNIGALAVYKDQLSRAPTPQAAKDIQDKWGAQLQQRGWTLAQMGHADKNPFSGTLGTELTNLDTNFMATLEARLAAINKEHAKSVESTQQFMNGGPNPTSAGINARNGGVNAVNGENGQVPVLQFPMQAPQAPMAPSGTGFTTAPRMGSPVGG